MLCWKKRHDIWLRKKFAINAQRGNVSNFSSGCLYIKTVTNVTTHANSSLEKGRGLKKLKETLSIFILRDADDLNINSEELNTCTPYSA